MDMWRRIVENFPLIHVVGATGTLKMFETKDLIGAIIIGLLSATGSSLLTTRELAVKFQVFERQQIQTEVAQKQTQTSSTKCSINTGSINLPFQSASPALKRRRTE